jgi:plasmid stabilization system protein ParE
MDFKVIFKDAFIEDLEEIVRGISTDNPLAAIALGELLVLCNRYGLPIAARSLGEFQEASEAPAPKAFGAA